ncbi:class I SAM-dependent methyltransferase [Arthrobacter sp. UYEF20]|uniref:class I SAM-dependent methyltransferase n=1 Tax=Arthrobacter sp. UYEF20 TaxID=1756363 RepID=UPI0033969711
MTVALHPGSKAGVFGYGAGEPYARALRRGGGSLTLRPESGEPGAASGAGVVQFDVLDWCAEASAVELRLLQGLNGPVLDIGCGPGRMLSAARTLGLGALGLDTSAEAVALARDRGVRALHQSVFSGVPLSGSWQSVLLLDGNIGIGGNIAQLLGRCRQLVAPRGRCWSKLTRTRTPTPSTWPYWKMVAGTGANRFPGRGRARQGWRPGRRRPAGR